MLEMIGTVGWIIGFVTLAGATIYNGMANRILGKTFQDQRAEFALLRKELADERDNEQPLTTEYGLAYNSGGSMLTHTDGAFGLSVEDWIAANSQFGGVVHTRMVRVEQPWQPIQAAPVRIHPGAREYPDDSLKL